MTKEEWQIIRDRNARYDGKLFCGLINQKIVCAPSCPLRAREARNVAIFRSLEEALSQGYKPCGHCRPDRPNWKGAKHELVQAAKQYIEEHSAEKFSLATLSASLYINGSYLLRTFRENTGCTLLWYHNFVRCEKAKALLAQGEVSISQAGEQAGFTSSSHFSHVFRKMTGMTPSEYRSDYFRQLEN
ncbi:MAG: methylphosphotriester-DNA--protein-cysteine methyltransferase family protein [Clostridia bacterium]|nr:methylphosphotriester-DNA--protein-cysteine methyltransferase family protein [Clostridia bacterium]